MIPSNHVKEWNNSYERLTPLVVPRSSTKIAQDEDYTLFNVTVFKKIKEEYCQKCREKKFVIRDFVYDESEIEKSRTQQKEYEQHEKELWVSHPLLRHTYILSNLLGVCVCVWYASVRVIATISNQFFRDFPSDCASKSNSNVH
jgi:hypothetical protein